MSADFIALDWGTTSFRAYHVDGAGKVVREIADGNGILSVKDGAFEEALERHIGDWDKSLPVLAAGMITSRQGWIELPYVDCPARAGDLAKALHRHETKAGRVIHFSTGLYLQSDTLGHDVMRSEETQVFGSLGEGFTHFITPGTHSKWIDVEGERIVRFATYMTGETFSLLRNQSILGRLMTSDEPDEVAFTRGVVRALADPSGLLHSLFSVRSLGLFNEIAADGLSSYLSGLVIGCEVAHALQSRSKRAGYMILASPKIGGRYAKALEVAGVAARYGEPLAIVRGLRKIGMAAGILT
jgi:2-dehydro-3-deoxygalactonokinase